MIFPSGLYPRVVALSLIFDHWIPFSSLQILKSRGQGIRVSKYQFFENSVVSTREGKGGGELGLRKNFKTAFGTLIPPPKKKVVFIFIVWRPVPSKMLFLFPTPKIVFRSYFRKSCFFLKKPLWKIFERRYLQKRSYWFLMPDAPSPQNDHVLPQMGYSHFSPKIPPFSKNLFYNKTFVT